jgi:hypothetical protein
MSASLTDFAGRLNDFLYRQHIRRLGSVDIGLAREWSLGFIRQEHPQLTEEEVTRFYENLIQVRLVAVDEWTLRMS